MFKRKDWLHTKGQDGGQDSDSSVSSGGASQSSEEASESSDQETSDPGEEKLINTRLEDLSESDYGGASDQHNDSGGEEASSGNSEEDQETQLYAQLSDWMQNAKVPAKGRPLRCRICPEVLILGPAALQQHLSSKRHKKGVSQLPADHLEVMDFAENIRLRPIDGETHQERLQRVRHQDELQTSGVVDEHEQSKLQPSAGRKRKMRPGKRQRQEQRQQQSLPKAGRRKREAQN